MDPRPLRSSQTSWLSSRFGNLHKMVPDCPWVSSLCSFNREKEQLRTKLNCDSLLLRGF